MYKLKSTYNSIVNRLSFIAFANYCTYKSRTRIRKKNRKKKFYLVKASVVTQYKDLQKNLQ